MIARIFWNFVPKDWEHSQAESKTISIKKFVDFDLDIVGFYALGHHNPRNFLAVVREQAPYEVLSVHKVRRAWAEFDGGDFKEMYERTAKAQPITLIEVYE